MNLHYPKFRTSPDGNGRFFTQCLVCMDSSSPTTHKPALADWMKAHAKEAATPPRLKRLEIKQ